MKIGNVSGGGGGGWQTNFFIRKKWAERTGLRQKLFIFPETAPCESRRDNLFFVLIAGLICHRVATSPGSQRYTNMCRSRNKALPPPPQRSVHWVGSGKKFVHYTDGAVMHDHRGDPVNDINRGLVISALNLPPPPFLCNIRVLWCMARELMTVTPKGRSMPGPRDALLETVTTSGTIFGWSFLPPPSPFGANDQSRGVAPTWRWIMNFSMFLAHSTYVYVPLAHADVQSTVL